MKLKVNYPNLAKDASVQIGGIGEVKNGEEITLTDNQKVAFLAVHGRTLEDAFKDDEHVKVTGTTGKKLEEKADVPDTHEDKEES